MVSMAIAVLVGLLLSLFWTMEDLGVSQRNKKTGEVRMIGKYLGIILPIVFGFAGYLSLLHDITAYQALVSMSQIVIALYPPFVTLAVCHFLYIQRNADTEATNVIADGAMKTLPNGRHES